ncbi:unnamed protein product [Protopolystoma xenopodis]|uniref:Fibronectin type-III domain-containing protein n=1 Tax=Protopolystoma xenopodis TaxID=117903 RepID=A0A3S4ZTF6_9PLAT|nr:unnamed protein product [Protopolystoma xenopodis]
MGSSDLAWSGFISIVSGIRARFPRILATTPLQLPATAAPPASPTQLVCVGLGHDFLAVAWQPPHGEKYAISSYMGKLTSAKTSSSFRTWPDQRSHKFTQLKPAEEYEITVLAIVDPNIQGLGGGIGPYLDPPLKVSTLPSSELLSSRRRCSSFRLSSLCPTWTLQTGFEPIAPLTSSQSNLSEPEIVDKTRFVCTLVRLSACPPQSDPSFCTSRQSELTSRRYWTMHELLSLHKTRDSARIMHRSGAHGLVGHLQMVQLQFVDQA